MKFWLVKSDPDSYGWDEFEKDGNTDWDGVRNYQARNNLQEMKKGDKVLFYHSVTTRDVVGVAEVAKEAYQDPTTDDDRWVAVELKVDKKLKYPVNLKDIKQVKQLENIALIKQSRLSVMPLTKTEFDTIIKMADEA
jgi:predicted RNA-binding protein with PUA-like domain